MGTIKSRPLSNADVRRKYLERVAQIEQLNEQWVKDGIALDERARRAWSIRHDARLEARQLMTSREEVELLQTRDQAKYGNPDGPTFEWLTKNLALNGLAGDTLYDAILEGSYRTNETVNRLLR